MGPRRGLEHDGGVACRRTVNPCSTSLRMPSNNLWEIQRQPWTPVPEAEDHLPFPGNTTEHFAPDSQPSVAPHCLLITHGSCSTDHTHL